MTPPIIFEFAEIGCFPATKKELSRSPDFQWAVFEDWGDSMLVIAIVAAAAGLVLRFRFSPIALTLLIITTTIVFAVCMWGGGGPLVLTLQLLATLASVQISYLVGCLLAEHIPTRAKIHSGGKQMRYVHEGSTRAGTR